MIWKTYRYSEGDHRVRKLFAWLPTRVAGGYTLWLQFYKVEEVFQCFPDGCRWVKTKSNNLPRLM